MSMNTFHLQIVTPDGQVYDGPAARVLCRTIAGDVCILPRHCDYITALGMGEARVTLEDGTVRRGACIGGMLTVRAGQVRLVATTFEWAEDIDKARARGLPPAGGDRSGPAGRRCPRTGTGTGPPEAGAGAHPCGESGITKPAFAAGPAFWRGLHFYVRKGGEGRPQREE